MLVTIQFNGEVLLVLTTKEDSDGRARWVVIGRRGCRECTTDRDHQASGVEGVIETVWAFSWRFGTSDVHPSAVKNLDLFTLDNSEVVQVEGECPVRDSVDKLFFTGWILVVGVMP